MILWRLSGLSACRGVGFELGELSAQGLNEQLSLLGRMSACRSVEFKPGELCALRLNEQLVPREREE